MQKTWKIRSSINVILHVKVLEYNILWKTVFDVATLDACPCMLCYRHNIHGQVTQSEVYALLLVFCDLPVPVLNRAFSDINCNPTKLCS